MLLIPTDFFLLIPTDLLCNHFPRTVFRRTSPPAAASLALRRRMARGSAAASAVAAAGGGGVWRWAARGECFGGGQLLGMCFDGEAGSSDEVG